MIITTPDKPDNNKEYDQASSIIGTLGSGQQPTNNVTLEQPTNTNSNQKQISQVISMDISQQPADSTRQHFSPQTFQLPTNDSKQRTTEKTYLQPANSETVKEENRINTIQPSINYDSREQRANISIVLQPTNKEYNKQPVSINISQQPINAESDWSPTNADNNQHKVFNKTTFESPTNTNITKLSAKTGNIQQPTDINGRFTVKSQQPINIDISKKPAELDNGKQPNNEGKTQHPTDTWT